MRNQWRRRSRRQVLGWGGMVVVAIAASGAAAFRPTLSQARPVAQSDESVAGLTIAEQAAQMFVLPVAGTILTAEERSWLQTIKPGGVLLVGSNIGTPDETAVLIADILATNPGLPPLVAVDQEGGVVQRLPGDPFPAAPELGTFALGDLADLAGQRARFLAEWNVSTNLAPVADIAWDASSFMADRAFGSEPEAVAEAVAAYVAGASGFGVAHAAKHFPGHGRGVTDSHVALPTVDVAMDVWRATDALPFAAAIAADVEMVMLGHLLYSQWDALPASLSPVAVSLLREDLGFAGVVVTDDLGMAALADYGALQTVDLAVAAGVDLLLYAIPTASPQTLVTHLLDQVDTGVVSSARITQSASRIVGMKQRLATAGAT